jgi:hypothetical protein
MARRKGPLVKAIAGVYRVSHTVPLVGFLIAALLAVGWWHFHADLYAPWRGLAVGLGALAIFFAAVAGIGFALIVLERLAARPARRRGR